MTDQEFANVIKEFIVSHRYPPTVKELCKITNTKSSSSINQRLHILKAKGMIHFIPGSPRTITVPGLVVSDISNEK